MEPKKIAEVITPADITALIRDKYEGDRDADITEDLKRLASGEPLAYVIGWIPFLNLKIYLDVPSVPGASHASVRPLIPRPETEWWTEKLISHLKYKFDDKPFTLLDLCAGSGAMGLAVLAALPNAKVSFGEITPEFKTLIEKNLTENNLDVVRADIRIGDLFVPFEQTAERNRFDIIATNPPYIPDNRSKSLDLSVTDFEPREALFSGPDGLNVIKRIIKVGPRYMKPDGELWMECDISNIGEAENLLRVAPEVEETSTHEDQYGRPRLLTAHFK